MKTALHLGAASLLLLAGMGSAAADQKLTTGIRCIPLNTTAWEGLSLSPLGISNGSANTRYVACSIPLDSEAGSEGTVTLRFKSGASSGKVACSVMIGDGSSGYVASTQELTLAANSTGDLSATYQTDFALPLGLNCALPPQFKLGAIRLYEARDTHTETGT